ncbi:type II secretion system minor pseudopilin GspH [Chiayiivirga flava]|uniref:Type II secretion system protein H n=1 Tax=Chiayiivirga flava TaxID=659595 RepID=A0A7W8D3J6_9GAMM|nr:type II secretion system minor pseudopilin GspH [Chiayiivirga flava]MBB5207239.1 general secretion pathway protein H [Chiayiivirga flava]
MNATRAVSRGFTLIELLVVIAIVGVVTAAVTLSLRGSGAREVENAARRAQALVSLACERAVIGGRDIGFSPVLDGLRFGYFERDRWEPIDNGRNDELRPRALGAGIALRAERDGEPVTLDAEPPAEPPFACFSTGELTPFVLQIARADAPQPWRLEGRLDGTLELREGDDVR